ncbi:MAG: hypothetical protein COT85_03275 [Chlamydiae bacterium CG10_big_fil_rev_8_21_14_0_10_42_34]|nr:MAG: hypothetical protein COT85_03275 [Chlamydiae bacterium CG10_big_fil_rev_8_21_14_0_10_42_34]
MIQIQTTRLSQLETIFSAHKNKWDESTIEKVFEIVKKTICITEENFLEVSESNPNEMLFVDQITCTHLGTNRLMWGIAFIDRPFIAFQVVISKNNERFKQAVILSHRSKSHNQVVQAGGRAIGFQYFQIDSPKFFNKTFTRGILNVENHVEQLRALFEGKTIQVEGKDIALLTEDTVNLLAHDTHSEEKQPLS